MVGDDDGTRIAFDFLVQEGLEFARTDAGELAVAEDGEDVLPQQGRIKVLRVLLGMRQSLLFPLQRELAEILFRSFCKVTCLRKRCQRCRARLLGLGLRPAADTLDALAGASCADFDGVVPFLPALSEK